MGGLGKRHECHKHRVTTTDVSDGFGDDRQTVDSYNALGQLTEEEANPYGGSEQPEITKHQYDADGNQIESSDFISGTTWATTDTQYNADGQAWDVQGPADANGNRPETITLYDLDGESCESQVKQGGAEWAVTDTTYDADGNGGSSG